MKTENKKKLSKSALCLIAFYFVLWLIRDLSEHHWWISSGNSITGYTYSNLELLQTYLKMIVLAIVIAVLPYEKIYSSLMVNINNFTSDKFNKNNVYSIFLVIGYMVSSLLVCHTYKRMFKYDFESETIVFLILLIFMLTSVYVFEYGENKVINILVHIAMLVFNYLLILSICKETNFIIIMNLFLVVFFIFNLLLAYKKDGLKYGICLVTLSMAGYFFSAFIMNFNLNNFNETSVGFKNAFTNINIELDIFVLCIFTVILVVFIIFILRLGTCIYRFSRKRCEMLIGLFTIMVILFIGNFYSTACELICLALMVRLLFIFPKNKENIIIDDDEYCDEIEEVFNDVDRRLSRIENQLGIEESDDERFDNSKNTSVSDKREEY
ncbi:MAG: hypothetical protein IJA34_11005 [Lachnospiraceae bacterium]|nr:hypothetical protein [Lachnospiraceae bacterium]